MTRIIEWDELREHTTLKDCWITMHGIVFQVPEEELIDHPGGMDIVLQSAGRDCTEDFEYAGHGLDTKERIMNYKIGVLVGHKDADIKVLGDCSLEMPVDENTQPATKFPFKICGPLLVVLIAFLAYLARRR
eukprot:GEMP01039622.1.p1 GENE.GEMP01039622.1~~GEMP01039622.1.p1  ORF type:complete len:132 (+),score=20.81 GEMP01039622.1:46-441(+)